MGSLSLSLSLSLSVCVCVFVCVCVYVCVTGTQDLFRNTFFLIFFKTTFLTCSETSMGSGMVVRRPSVLPPIFYIFFLNKDTTQKTTICIASCVFVCACVCERETECVCVCVCERERECVCVCRRKRGGME